MKDIMQTPEKSASKDLGHGGPSPSGEKLQQILSGGLDKGPRDQSLGSVGSAFGGGQKSTGSVNMSMNISEKGAGGYDSSRSGAAKINSEL